MILDHVDALITLGIVAGGVYTSFVVARARGDDDRERISELEKWKGEHDKESSNVRGRLEGELNAHRTLLAVGETNMKQMKGDIREIKDDMKTLLGRRRQDREEGDAQ